MRSKSLGTEISPARNPSYRGDAGASTAAIITSGFRALAMTKALSFAARATNFESCVFTSRIRAYILGPPVISACHATEWHASATLILFHRSCLPATRHVARIIFRLCVSREWVARRRTSDPDSRFISARHATRCTTNVSHLRLTRLGGTTTRPRSRFTRRIRAKRDVLHR